MEEGNSNGLTVSAPDLDSDVGYTIGVTTDSGNIGFDSSCGDRQEDGAVTSGSTSHISTLMLHGCVSPGGPVTATLLSGGVTMETATHEVDVNLVASG